MTRREDSHYVQNEGRVIRYSTNRTFPLSFNRAQQFNRTQQFNRRRGLLIQLSSDEYSNQYRQYHHRGDSEQHIHHHRGGGGSQHPTFRHDELFARIGDAVDDQLEPRSHQDDEHIPVSRRVSEQRYRSSTEMSSFCESSLPGPNMSSIDDELQAGLQRYEEKSRQYSLQLQSMHNNNESDQRRLDHIQHARSLSFKQPCTVPISQSRSPPYSVLPHLGQRDLGQPLKRRRTGASPMDVINLDVPNSSTAERKTPDPLEEGEINSPSRSVTSLPVKPRQVFTKSKELRSESSISCVGSSGVGSSGVGSSGVGESKVADGKSQSKPSCLKIDSDAWTIDRVSLLPNVLDQLGKSGLIDDSLLEFFFRFLHRYVCHLIILSYRLIRM